MKIGTDMKYNYLILALASIALFSCTRNEVKDPNVDGELVTIRAYQEGATETRTTLVDGGTQVYWEPSDEIKVFFRGSGSRFISQNTQNVTVTDFSGTMNVVVGINEGASGSNTLWGLYPYRADATSDDASVTTTLPAEQTGRAGSFSKGTNITLAHSNSFDLAFYNVTGGIRFSLTQEGVKEVVFEGQNNENIAGKVKIAFADGVPAIQQVVEGQKTITLTAPNGGTFETGKWYYIVALPGTLSGGFKMTFNTATQYATLKSSGSKTIKRGIFGSLAEADENLIYKDKGGDEPQTGNIVFADLAAKYACVAKFDTNGDGEVSVEEAEAATSFEGLFTDWKGVKCFDEISYFKNVHSLSGVFDGCNKLVSITIPENITDLGTSAFSDCSSLSSVVLPSGITAIGDETFQGCTSLSSIDIPASVTWVGPGAFSWCSSLVAVELPSGVTAITNYAFSNCTSLNSIDLPMSVTSVGQDAFHGCSSLASINLPSQLKTIGQSAFSGCSSLTQVVIPEGVTSIPMCCFQNCNSLTSVTIPEGVTSVGYSAFWGVKMWKLELPSSITSLGGACFDGIICIILPSTSPVSIESGTFYSVKGIFVPSSLIDVYGAMTNWANYASQLHPLDAYKEKNEFTLATSGAVYMGTSVKWAAYNLGATKPEEYGDYYAWGEVQTKDNYDWSTYKWCNGSSNTLTKYCNSSSYGNEGFTDNKTLLEPDDDAAHINLGGNWRIPTYDEWTELLDGGVWEWTTYDGIYGYKIYGIGSGNILFLPAAGERRYSGFKNVGSNGLYWSSSIYSYVSDPWGGWYMSFNANSNYLSGYSRSLGLSIRPVFD